MSYALNGYDEEMSSVEIGSAIGVTRQAVEARIKKNIKKLNLKLLRLLREEGIDFKELIS